jgi:hypothetical protein
VRSKPAAAAAAFASSVTRAGLQAPRVEGTRSHGVVTVESHALPNDARRTQSSVSFATASICATENGSGPQVAGRISTRCSPRVGNAAAAGATTTAAAANAKTSAARLIDGYYDSGADLLVENVSPKRSNSAGLRANNQGNPILCGGQYTKNTLPMMFLRGTVPHTRESHDDARLSPIMK